MGHLKLEPVWTGKGKTRKPKSDRIRVQCPNCPSKMAEKLDMVANGEWAVCCLKCRHIFYVVKSERKDGE